MEDKKRIKQKLELFTMIVFVIFGILIARLFFLQVVNAAEFRSQSESNRTRLFYEPACRGEIVDRNGKVLATNKPVFNISVVNLEEKNQGKVIRELSKILGRYDVSHNPEKITQELLEQYRIRSFQPVEVARLPWGEKAFEIVSEIEEKRSELPGVMIRSEPLRYYPGENLAGHVLGFIGKISQQELEQYKDYKYGNNEWIGKYGLERVFENYTLSSGEVIGLRGKKGFRAVEVDANNRTVRELATVSSAPGDSLVLTLDYDLQSALEKGLDEAIDRARGENPKAGAGAGVVLDVNSGAILAMASRPSINPNDFVNGNYKNRQSYYNSEKYKPFLNRAIQGVYPPGSTFKMVTGMAALEAGVINPKDTIICRGYYWKPPYIKDWEVHGKVDFIKALAKSCNTYFQYIADITGIKEIVRVATEFGLGEKTGLKDITGEAEGTLPSPQWKEELGKSIVEREYKKKYADLEAKYRNLIASAKDTGEVAEIKAKKQKEISDLENWYHSQMWSRAQWHPYDTFNTSIGQGSNNYTLLQLANYIAAIANGGTRYRPYLVKSIKSQSGEILETFHPEKIHEVSLSKDTIEKVRLGMKAVTKPGGTAYFLFHDFPPAIQLAAKTGTAQTGRGGDDRNRDFHGVFVGFAPYNNPQIAVALLVEYGQSGSGTAGRVAREIFREYFALDEESTESKENGREVPEGQGEFDIQTYEMNRE